MKKISQRSFIVMLVLGGILLYYTLTNYDFLPVIKKALSPVIGGFVIAYLLEPMVRLFVKLGKGKISRGFSILLSVIVVIMFIILMSAVLIPSISDSIESIAGQITKLVNQVISGEINLDWFENFLNGIKSNLFNDVMKMLQDSINSMLVKLGEITQIVVEGSLAMFASISSSLVSFFMAFIVALYMLGGKADLMGRVKRLNYALFEKSFADELVRIIRKADEIFNSFFVGKIIDSAIIGVICFVLMWLFKIPNSPAIGFFVGVTNIIPYFGPFIGAIPAILVTLATGSLVKVFIVIALIVAIQQFDGLVLGPKILGDKVGVGAFWIIVSVTAGGAIAGLVGMFVGVPVVVLFKTLIEEFVDKKLKEKNLNV